MEPRPIERGNHDAAQRITAVNARFNGATPNRAWKLVSGIAAQFGALRFNGATPNRAWKPLPTGTSASAQTLLQWSHAQSSVETPFLMAGGIPRTWLQWSHAQSSVETWYASVAVSGMSLLQWSHAQSSVETRRLLALPLVRLCFNGATPNRAWKLCSVMLIAESSIRFNGATPNRAWKPRPARIVECRRHRASMEPRPIERGNLEMELRIKQAQQASMEPRPIERGNRRLRERTGQCAYGFNGATPNRAWKPRNNRLRENPI